MGFLTFEQKNTNKEVNVYFDLQKTRMDLVRLVVCVAFLIRKSTSSKFFFVYNTKSFV